MKFCIIMIKCTNIQIYKDKKLGDLMTKLIIDTTCDRNDEMLNDPNLEIIPLHITLDNETYLDGEEIQLHTVYDYMRAEKVPKTSQISYDSITKTLNKCISEGHDIIYMAFSSKLSGTYSFASQIFEDYKTKYPNTKFELIDSKGGAGGGALIALQALKMIKRGFAFEDIVHHIKWSIDHVIYHFTLKDLKWLVLGGRLNKVAGYIGSTLHIKPYLVVEDGLIKVKELIRGQKRIYKKILNDVKNGVGKFVDQTIAISHADDEETARYIETKIKEMIPECKTIVFEIGAVLGSHLGIGGIGIFYYNEKPVEYQ